MPDPDTKLIYGWTAKRSGAAITIYGRDGDGVKISLGGIATLEARDGHVEAVMPSGSTFKLIPAAPVSP